MKQPLAHRFQRIIEENLPKRKEMFSVLMENSLEGKLFSQKGVGLKSIFKHIGRLTDFKGIYAFIQNNKIVYIDESSYVLRRIMRQYKGVSKYQLKLANIMLNIHKENNPSYTIEHAQKDMEDMKVIFMDVPDDLERQITTLYLQCHFECIYNRFD